ncbi:MAG: hypothetical protein HRT45_08625 [Bdellovibrionales bacterium]|nr:hypothetical protein [Bdellovibrionales bacterium]
MKTCFGLLKTSFERHFAALTGEYQFVLMLAGFLIAWSSQSAANNVPLSTYVNRVHTSYLYPYETNPSEPYYSMSSGEDPGLSSDWGDLSTLSPFVLHGWDLEGTKALGVFEWVGTERSGLSVELDPADYSTEVLKPFFTIGDDEKKAQALRYRDQMLQQQFEKLVSTVYANRQGLFIDGEMHIRWQGSAPSYEETRQITQSVLQGEMRRFDEKLLYTIRNPFVENGWDLAATKQLGLWEWDSFYQQTLKVELYPTEYDKKYLSQFFSMSDEHKRTLLQYRARALSEFFQKLASRTYVNEQGLFVDGKQHLKWDGHPLAEAGVREVTRRILQGKLREYDEQLFYTSKVIADKNEIAFVIRATAQAVFWIPNLRGTANHKNIGGGGRAVTFIVGRRKVPGKKLHAPELDFFISRDTGERAQFLPSAEFAPYLMVGFMRGHDYFADREKVDHYLQVVSAYARSYSPLHVAHMLILGSSYPPIVTAGNTYLMKEVKRTTLANIEDARKLRKQVDEFIFGLAVARRVYQSRPMVENYNLSVATLSAFFSQLQEGAMNSAQHIHNQINQIAGYLNTSTDEKLKPYKDSIAAVTGAVRSAQGAVAYRLGREGESFMLNFYEPVVSPVRSVGRFCSNLLNGHRRQNSGDRQRSNE